MQRFGNEHFNKFSGFIYENFGIYTNDAKREILHTKLDKLMSKNNMRSYDEYYGNLSGKGNKALLNDFANEITVNYTAFFREKNHFEFVMKNVARLFEYRPGRYGGKEIRAWSAACSTGEEPYTLAMVLKEALPEGVNIRILATDINSNVLATAQQGIYSPDIKDDVEKYYLDKYFHKTPGGYVVSESIKKLVSFRSFNLMGDFPFKNTFDLVFCRNVMIYFDTAVRQNLLNKFYKIIHTGGLLFIGHSESLAGKCHKFKYVQPTVYVKN